ncbi:MAG: N-acetyltransferase [Planctomycetes bacterium]|nr:N-acetyltransferase [Planctomycetota bacterium]
MATQTSAPRLEPPHREPVTNPAKSGLIRLGENVKIDTAAILGYMPGRKLASLDLEIGSDSSVRAGSVIYLGSKIGQNMETGHNVVIREENVIGDHFRIWNGSTIDYGCRIGNGVKIHCNCYVAQYTVLEDDVFMAPGVTIANDLHPGCKLSMPCLKGPTLKRGVQVGCNVTILPYVTIGEYALIGAGSVVVKDVPARTVVAGNPARPIKSVYALGCPTGLTDRPYREEEQGAGAALPVAPGVAGPAAAKKRKR